MLPIASKYGNEVFGDTRIFPQDAANPHLGHLTQEWCPDNFASFIDRDRWPPNSPDLNPLNDFVWDELINSFNLNKVRSKMGDTA